MDSSHYPNGMPYYGDGTGGGNGAGGRHSYPSQQPNPQSAFHASLPNLQATQQYEQTTLPPLQSQPRPPAGTSSSLFDHYNRPHQQPGFPSAAASQLNSYGGPGAPFGGQFANFSHESLLPQQHQGYPMQHDPAGSGYMNDLRNPGFGGLSSPLPPPLPSSQAYGSSFPGAYDQSPGHVVGAQGRRGILPSDDGRPSAVSADGSTTTRTNIMPVKDADGKYPCPHCTKSYLHAKHLKRHLLRHTGDRPYSCFLCNDTFSRSDILKRHFQKCSIRRGNPTGASHLQNSQSHLRKQQAAKRSSNDLSKADTKSLPDSETTSIASATTSRPASDNFSSIRSDGRTDSGISTKSSIISRDARSLTGAQPLTPIKPEQGSYSQPVTSALPFYSGRDMAYTGGSIGTHGFQPHEPVSEPQHSGDFAWTGMPQQIPHAPDGAEYAQSYYDAGPGDQPDMLGHQQNYSPWQTTQQLQLQSQSPQQQQRQQQQQQQQQQSLRPPKQQNDASFLEISHRLISFLHVEDAQDDESLLIRANLSPESVEHYLDKYQNFHIHWPHVHLRSFNPLTSYAGLTLAMITIGAVYSDRVDLSQVRVLMTRTKLHIRENSEVGRAASDPGCDVSGLVDNPGAYDQIVALSLLTTLILWHADPEQRQMLNSDHPGLCHLLKRMGMLKPLPRSYPGYSELHQLDMMDSFEFDFELWMRQEKRSRALYTTVLTDMGQFLYFNTRPNFSAEEIEVPLPSDDATWEAADAQQCAIALGVHGPEAQEASNMSGSRRLKQLEFNKAMSKLATGEAFEQRSTNAFGRFLLVHGVHIQIWFAQHPHFASGELLGTSLSVPIPEARADSPAMMHLDNELQNWRCLSDNEDALQYPPGAPPRLGFCRDGKTYFWLGKLLIKNTGVLGPNTHWQHRFRVMVQALKQAKANSANETRADGALLTLTADIVDPAYGMDDLTLDMKLLFTPLTPDGSPVGSETFQSFDPQPHQFG